MTAAKLNCRELIDFIESYLEGELPEAQRVVFEAHLDVCPYCRDYLESYRATVRLGRRAYPEEGAEAPEDVPRPLIEAILAARARKS